MSTPFASLPIVDLCALQTGLAYKDLKREDAVTLSNQFYDVFASTGFAYLANAPLSYSHDDIFSIGREFFEMSDERKMQLAKKTFNPTNANTFRGYFPTQPLGASDNLKEGFELGPAKNFTPTNTKTKFNMSESNVWPSETVFKRRADLEKLYSELQSLSAQLLALLAVSLGKSPDFFDDYLVDSVSTLRLLHYPPVDQATTLSSSTVNSETGSSTSMNSQASDSVKLSCTPHTDSGILTLLHQDSTGGLEVRNAAGEWIAAPYIPGTIVVNIGDLMAEVSGGRFVATMHRVRAPRTQTKTDESKLGRFSVPFFFEPGERCVVRSVDGARGPGILYGDHVRAKMATWIEYQDEEEQ